MAIVSSRTDHEVTRKVDCYIHIQNLPWSACHGDLKDHFKDYNITEGGILIHGTDAFLAADLRTALAITDRGEDSILGQNVHLSIMDLGELRNAVFKNVRRRLHFSDVIQDSVNKFLFPLKRRKIRPTHVSKSRILSCSMFSVDEVESVSIPLKNCESLPCGTRKRGCGRKIHPTSAEEWNVCEKIPVFHPEEYIEFRNANVALETRYAQ